MTDITPAKDTYLASVLARPGLPGRKIVNCYYQSREGVILYFEDGSPIEAPPKTIFTDCLQMPTPLAAVQVLPIGPVTIPWPPSPIPPSFALAKTESNVITTVTSTSSSGEVHINTAPGSRFAAFTGDLYNLIIHYQRDENPGDAISIFERQFRQGEASMDGVRVADNASLGEPLASSVGDTPHTPPIILEALKAKLLSEGPEKSFTLGNPRWTVYHAVDGNLWLSHIWDTLEYKTIFVANPISSVNPKDMYPNSPLALARVDGRPVVYYINIEGQIQRVIQTAGKWEEPVTIDATPKPRPGTNLAVVANFAIFTDCLHDPVRIAYQDEEGKIQAVTDNVLMYFGPIR